MKTTRTIVRNLALLIPTLAAIPVPAFAQSGNTWLGTGPAGGNFNTGLGASAMSVNTGSYNTATGRRALWQNASGTFNVANGYHALYLNMVGYGNVAIGALALENTGANNAQNANNNTGVGYLALKSNISGQGNTALGSSALFSAGTSGNTAIGSGALVYATGGNNTALGAGATTCQNCNNTTSVGYSAETGVNATAVGYEAHALNHAIASGYDAQANNYATAFGVSSRAGITAVAAGYFAQALATNSTAVGQSAQVIATATNSMALGSGALVTASNAIRIGNGAITSITGNVNFFGTSDGRYKTNVKENVPGLEFISKLKPVTFKWDLGKLNKLDGAEEFATDPVLGEAREAKAKKVYTGFIAQDVEAAAMECGYDFSGVHKPANDQSEYSLAYAEFVVPLVKAVQEQQKEIEELQKTVRALATGDRLPNSRLGAAPAPTTAQHAGVLENFWGGAMTLLSAGLVLMHLKRRRESAPAR
jgi:trimeric autotransporter adhesin